MLCRIQVLLGGITAEKLFVGDISTGASSDLKRATEIARRMVTEWGMSSEVGMVYCGNDDAVFIGKNYQERMSYSENQAALIDSEVKKIIELCQKETEKILKTNKDKLMTMADVLLEKETIYAEEVDMIIDGKSKEEILQHIDNKDKKPEDKDVSSETKNDEKIEEKTAENNENKLKTVDELLKEAENREKALKAEDVKEPEEVKVETEELKPKTTRKRTSTKTEGAKKSTPKKRTVKKQTEKDTEKNDKIEE